MPRIALSGLLALVAATALFWTPAVEAAVPPSWKETGFAIEPAGMSLRRVLEQFGQVYGVQLEFGVADVAVKKERLRSDGGAEFLDRLAQPYRFNWFVYGDTLHIVPRGESVSARLEVGEDAVQDAKGVLVGMGLFDSRFGWGELPDEGVVTISGPREYVRLAREILMPDEAKAARKERQIMVFRLKYASATDRTISARDKTETIPGIKTILSSLIFEQPASKYDDPAASYERKSKKRSRRPENGKGTAREVGTMPLPAWGKSGKGGESVPPPVSGTDSDDEQDDDGPGPRGAKSPSPSGGMRPRIEADPSMNAIMIYDQVSKRKMYQALIDQLDVQPQQIEIEALIVDIDRSKLSELGVEWGVRSSGGNVNGTINSTAADTEGLALPLPGSTLLISNLARFYARLKLMEGTGDARVLATPTVLTLNNVAAVLDLSQTKYMQLVGERVANLEDITAGTMLRVIPRIVEDGASTRVRLEVDIEDGSLGDTANANVMRSTISTQAIIELQHTLMIGGYRTESISARQQKVPLLGAIPLFGNLFRNETKSQGGRERLFLITPRLVGSAGIAAAPESKAAIAARRLVAAHPKPAARALDATASAGVAQAAPVSAPAAVAITAPPAAAAVQATPSVVQAQPFKRENPFPFGASVKKSSIKCGPGKGIPWRADLSSGAR